VLIYLIIAIMVWCLIVFAILLTGRQGESGQLRHGPGH
jgi:hypothetical protein